MKHISVLLNESVNALNIDPNGIYVDATLGGGGHSLEILKQLNKGHLFAFDQDDFAIKKATERLKDYPNKTLIKANFSEMNVELEKLGIHKVDGILFDLGLSSFQIDDETRGFSYLKDHDLDMRMNKDATLTAKVIVNTYDRQKLADIFRAYGDEQNAWKIAGMIIDRRPIETTLELVEITDIANKGIKGHSAKRVFQALRIEVNKELEVLEKALNNALNILNPGGRLLVITFQSLEDKMVKQFFKTNSEINLPRNVDIRNLPKTPLKMITRKPIIPSELELKDNSRSHSAKLRVAEKQI
jgi:16S rRNA (cytosine1402-N4)-methyltransferase